MSIEFQTFSNAAFYAPAQKRYEPPSKQTNPRQPQSKSDANQTDKPDKKARPVVAKSILAKTGAAKPAALKPEPFSRPLSLQKPLKGFFLINDDFGWRTHPVTKMRDFHKGVDLDAERGDAVFSSASGKIVFGQRDGVHGLRLMIQHAKGVLTSYSHLKAYSDVILAPLQKGEKKRKVKIGATVRKGQILGMVGSTGRTSGPHLHYEIHINGKPVDPARYFKIS